MRVCKGDIVTTPPEEKAREDGIENLKKTKQKTLLDKMYANLMGCPAELQHTLSRGITSLMFWTHFCKNLPNFPAQFGWISACVRENCGTD